ncbi:MAG: glycosyltransferase family 2 protein [bacterium]
MDISIIIVNYNTKELTRNCLKSIFEKTEGVDFEVCVVDNNSHDCSSEMIEQDFPQVKLLKNKENKGFGAANNIAIRESNAKYVFLLNSDTVLLNNAIKIFFDFMEKQENQKIACCGGALYGEDLTPQHSYGNFPTIEQIFFTRFFLHKIFKNYYKKKFDMGSCELSQYIVEVDYITGADMFLRKSVLEETGLFDEDFFLYYEESELTYRMYKKGYKSAIIPQAQIIHFKEASTEKSLNKIKIVKQSELLFFEKCYGKKQKFLINLIHIFENILRCLFFPLIYRRADFNKTASIESAKKSNRL